MPTTTPAQPHGDNVRLTRTFKVRPFSHFGGDLAEFPRHENALEFVNGDGGLAIDRYDTVSFWDPARETWETEYYVVYRWTGDRYAPKDHVTVW